MELRCLGLSAWRGGLWFGFHTLYIFKLSLIFFLCPQTRRDSYSSFRGLKSRCRLKYILIRLCCLYTMRDSQLYETLYETMIQDVFWLSLPLIIYLAIQEFWSEIDKLEAHFFYKKNSIVSAVLSRFYYGPHKKN